MTRLAGLLLLLALTACTSDSTTGPTTSGGDERVVLESQRLVPSATGRFCSMDGTLRNDNGFRVSSLRIDLRARNAAGAEIGTAVIIEFGVPPGGRVAYASSFFSPGEIRCAMIDQVERLATRITR